MNLKSNEKITFDRRFKKLPHLEDDNNDLVEFCIEDMNNNITIYRENKKDILSNIIKDSETVKWTWDDLIIGDWYKTIEEIGIKWTSNWRWIKL